NPGQLSSGNRERNHYNCFSRIEIEKFADLLHRKAAVPHHRIETRTAGYWRSSTSQSPSSGEDNAAVTSRHVPIAHHQCTLDDTARFPSILARTRNRRT